MFKLNELVKLVFSFNPDSDEDFDAVGIVVGVKGEKIEVLWSNGIRFHAPDEIETVEAFEKSEKASQERLSKIVLSLKELRRIIREEVFGGSYPDESYDKELLDDPSIGKKSVLVPNDIKHSIKKWAKSMGLSTSGRSHNK